MSPLAHGHSSPIACGCSSPSIFDSSSPPIFSNTPFSNIPSHGIRKADAMEPSNSESDCSGCSDCESDSDAYAYNSDAPLRVTAAHIRGGAERRLKRSHRLAAARQGGRKRRRNVIDTAMRRRSITIYAQGLLRARRAIRS